MIKYKYEDDPSIVQQRPALIIGKNAVCLTVLKMTGTNRGDNLSEYVMKDWQQAGLTKETSIRLGRYIRLKPDDCVKYIGKISSRDKLNLEYRLAARSNCTR